MKALILSVLFICMACVASAQCRQALALGLDVSGSVDAREYRLQLDGLVTALGTPAVRQALLQQLSDPVHLLVYEWSGPEDQAVILPWTAITGPVVLDAARAQLREIKRRQASPGTALGLAMRAGLHHLAGRPKCWTRTLDISGDGKSNLGPRPLDIRQESINAGITINALVVGADAPAGGDARQAELSGLSRYFQQEVIVGQDSFVETALGFEAYAAAMARKLERELKTVVIGQAIPSRAATKAVSPNSRRP